MNLTIIAVRDSAVDAFMQPFFVHATGAAVRLFQDEVNKPGTPFHAHPEDYVLFELGVFDDSTGSVTMLPEPRQLARGKDFVEVNRATIESEGRQQRP